MSEKWNTHQWNLMVWNVPENLAGLLNRFGFQRTKRNPAHWYRLFDPTTDKELAEKVRQHFRDAGLKGSWREVQQLSRTRKSNFKAAPKPGHNGNFGYPNFAQHNSSPGTWRRKQKRK